MDKNLKSKEDKIYTYIVLVVGIIITYIYFYVLRPGSEYWSMYRTNFSYLWRQKLSTPGDLVEGLFIFLQIMFLVSWWYIRDDLVKLIRIINNKI
jgi:hypothetical protein